MTNEKKMVELTKIEQGAESMEDENLILLLLSPEFRKNYMKTLVNRLIDMDVIVAIEETNCSIGLLGLLVSFVLFTSAISYPICYRMNRL